MIDRIARKNRLSCRFSCTGLCKGNMSLNRRMGGGESHFHARLMAEERSCADFIVFEVRYRFADNG